MQAMEFGKNSTRRHKTLHYGVKRAKTIFDNQENTSH